MDIKYKFDIFRLKGRLSKIRIWMENHHVPPRMMFILMGIISTVWFLIRVIPKPDRAAYPCMRVAAPIMSGFFVYLLSLGGLSLVLKKAWKNLTRAKFVAASSLLVLAVVLLGINLTSDISVTSAQVASTGPEDGPNKPIGKAIGINPGRVIWAWNPDATNENCKNSMENNDWYFNPVNADQKVIGKMVSESVNKIGGKSDLKQSWDAIFRFYNLKKYQKDKGYTSGEKIFIKINQGTARWVLNQADKDNGYFFPTSLKPGEEKRKANIGACETPPYIVLEILRELVNEMGVNQADISIGDPMTPTYGHNYNIWHNEFPNVIYIDRVSEKFGRTVIKPTVNDLIFYSDKTQSDKLYDVIENADYLINIANLKPHGIAGISLTAKNHFGSQARPTASHLHYSLPANRSKGNPTNGGYKKYRVLVDLMGSRYLGQNTLLYIVDGLFGGGSDETKVAVKYFMAPFNDDWSNSIFISQDQVALESVCFDFLRTEWDGNNKHNPANNANEAGPNMHRVDDYLHQAADSRNWPDGIVYDPDNSGKPLPSLGVHEHWNNATDKQYSGNLDLPNGISLVTIPDTLVKSVASGKSDKPITVKSFDEGIQAKRFHSSTVDDDNVKWFLTESGIISFDGKKWILHNKNRKVTSKDMKGIVYDFSSYGQELWVATPEGATVASLPVDGRSGATTYYSENSKILSDNVLSVAVGKSPLRWFGTDKGISGFKNKKWLTYSYNRKYPEGMFQDFPITSMAASPDGDTLFAGTDGAGVVRVFRNDVDGISGASEYAQWGPILMPSDKVYSVYITPDGTQWFGTDNGAARHTGYNTLENWSVFNTDNGLADNFVQAICADKKGNIWLGTKGGVSVFDGSKWTSYKKEDGLISNNILSVIVDKQGLVWLGTDNGVTSFSNGKFVSYQ